VVRRPHDPLRRCDQEEGAVGPALALCRPLAGSPRSIRQANRLAPITITGHIVTGEGVGTPHAIASRQPAETRSRRCRASAATLSSPGARLRRGCNQAGNGTLPNRMPAGRVVRDDAARNGTESAHCRWRLVQGVGLASPREDGHTGVPPGTAGRTRRCGPGSLDSGLEKPRQLSREPRFPICLAVRNYGKCRP
jgi:hypothetical protein